MSIENMPAGKHSIELNIVGDGRAFLNFWDYAHGNDVTVEIENGVLWYTPPGEELPSAISIKEFLNRIAESISQRTV